MRRFSITQLITRLSKVSTLCLAGFLVASTATPGVAQVLIEKATAEAQTGELKGVEGQTITVEMSKTKSTATKTIDANCTILLNRRAAKLSELQSGDILRMTLSPANPQTVTKLVAARVDQDTPSSGKVTGRTPQEAPASKPEQPGAALGLRMSDSPNQGLLIVAIEENSPAARSKIVVGDYLMMIDNQKIETPDQVLSLLAQKAPQAEVRLQLWREGTKRNIDVQLTSTSRATDQHIKEPRLLLHNEIAKVNVPVFPAEEVTTHYGLSLYHDKARGCVVVDVSSKSYLAMAGLQTGDVLMEIDGKEVNTPLAAYEVLHDLPLAKEVEVVVQRDGKKLTRSFKTSAS